MTTSSANAFSTGAWVKGLAEWTDETGETAFLSVAFSWRIGDAAKRALWLHEAGYRVRVGGPGLFALKAHDLYIFDDIAEVGGSFPDALRQHNPMATVASRGCPVGCWFCTVPAMEGKTFTLLPDFPVRPVLCDNNLSALPAEYQDHIVARYRAAAVPLLDANSGFEPQTFDEDVYARWRPILKGPWRFGFDEKTEGAAVERAFRVLRDVPPRRKQVYTMIGHEPFDVCMDRIKRVIAWGGEPYAQPFMKLNALEKRPHVRFDWSERKLKQVQRWTNRHLWRKVDFRDYDASVKTNQTRRVV